MVTRHDLILANANIARICKVDSIDAYDLVRYGVERASKVRSRNFKDPAESGNRASVG